jgi:hypothetical protein
MRVGTIERQEHEYKRHGTRCLFANFEVATGKIIAPSIGPTRTNEDFAAHIPRRPSPLTLRASGSSWWTS